MSDQLNEQRGEIAALLSKQRRYLQLTQEEAAEKAGFSPRTVQRLEAGMMDLGHTKFINYCKVLDIDMTALMRRQLNNHGEKNNAKLPQDRSQRL
jgi:transcriptional regulator with XRE-family HTH domain